MPWCRSQSRTVSAIGLVPCVLLLFSALAQCPVSRAQSTTNFTVAGPASWNDPNSWDLAFVPGDDFSGEVAGISNAGIAFLDAPARFTVDGVVLGESGVRAEQGTLEIRGGGTLTVQPGGGTAGGRVLVGGSGQGTLEITGNGRLTTTSLRVAGSNASLLDLEDRAFLRITGNAELSRNTKLTGPQLQFDVGGDLTLNGRFTYGITAKSGSTITVPNGTANVGGTLAIATTGYTPTVGDAWTLVDAANLVGAFDAVDTTAAAPLEPGLGYALLYDPDQGTVRLRVGSRLTLRVDRQTGGLSIHNRVGTVQMDGYAIQSASGALSPANWNSLADQLGAPGGWAEANPTAKHLAELNLLGMTSLGPGTVLNMGTPYQPVAPSAFGEPVSEDIAFQFTTADGAVIDGLVSYEGPVRHNNLVLTVDPSTGSAAIRNPSFFDVAIDGYVIGSAAGSLSPAGWQSFDDQGLDQNQWAEANPSSSNLSELNLLGQTQLQINDAISIGRPFDTAQGVRDLTFEFLLADRRQPMQGIVEYLGVRAGDFDGDGDLNVNDVNLLNVEIDAGTHKPGFDLTGDGRVTFDDLSKWVSDPNIKHTWLGDANLDGEFNSGDFVQVFQRGEYEDAVANNSGWDEGDWNGDREFDTSDFVVAFQSGGYERGPRAAVAVPEPGNMVLLILGGLPFVAYRHRVLAKESSSLCP